MVSRLLLALCLCSALLLGACGADSPPEVCAVGCPEEACSADGICSSEVCAGPGECGAGLFCDLDIGWCRIGCDPGGCVDGRVCDAAVHACVDCSDAQLCENGLSCVAGRCGACAEDGDCGLGAQLYCGTAGYCVAGCNTNSHCPTSLVCDSARQRCVQCRSDNDCAGATCLVEEGVCQ